MFVKIINKFNILLLAIQKLINQLTNSNMNLQPKYKRINTTKPMKTLKLLSLSLLLAGVSACTKPSAPSFKKLQNVKITQARKDSITLTAQALYYNPNIIGGKVLGADINVFINDVPVGKLNQTEQIAIPKESEFEVPIAITFNPKQVFKNNRGFLQQALKSFFKNELAVKYDGTATMEILNVPFKVPVNYTDTVRLKLTN